MKGLHSPSAHFSSICFLSTPRKQIEKKRLGWLAPCAWPPAALSLFVNSQTFQICSLPSIAHLLQPVSRANSTQQFKNCFVSLAALHGSSHSFSSFPSIKKLIYWWRVKGFEPMNTVILSLTYSCRVHCCSSFKTYHPLATKAKLMNGAEIYWSKMN